MLPLPTIAEFCDIATLVEFFAERNFPDTTEGRAAQALVSYVLRAKNAARSEPAYTQPPTLAPEP